MVNLFYAVEYGLVNSFYAVEYGLISVIFEDIREAI